LSINEKLDLIKDTVRALKKHIKKLDRKYFSKKIQPSKQKLVYVYSIPTRNIWTQSKKIYSDLILINESLIEILEIVLEGK
jgi:hypothetical protein